MVNNIYNPKEIPELPLHGVLCEDRAKMCGAIKKRQPEAHLLIAAAAAKKVLEGTSRPLKLPLAGSNAPCTHNNYRKL